MIGIVVNKDDKNVFKSSTTRWKESLEDREVIFQPIKQQPHMRVVAISNLSKRCSAWHAACNVTFWVFNSQSFDDETDAEKIELLHQQFSGIKKYL